MLAPNNSRFNTTLLRDYLVEAIGKLLGGPQHAKVEANLFDLGLDSMMLVSIAATMGKELGFEVPATAFVEFPTIRAFVGNLAELMGLDPQSETSAPPDNGRLSKRARRATVAR